MAERSVGVRGLEPTGRMRGIPGNGRPRARRLAAGTLGAAILSGGSAGAALWPAVASAQSPTTTPPAAPPAGQAVKGAATVPGQAFTLVGGDGGVFNFGTNFYGSLARSHLAAPIVAAASLPGSKGYWLVGADGGVFAFGQAGFYGSLGGIRLAAPIVGIAPTSDGKGYWLVGADGGVFRFGDANFMGSLGNKKLAAPIVGISPTPQGDGYWLAGADGGVFTFGRAPFFGSAGGLHLSAAITGIATPPSGNGYWLVGKDGGVFTYGRAGFFGSRGGTHSPLNAVGLLTSPSGQGYWLADSGGNVYPYGDASMLGSLATVHLAAPIVAITSGASSVTATYPRPLYVGVTTDTSQGGQGGDDTPTVSSPIGGPYTASLAPGTSLPPGLLLESDGTLRGDAAAPATFAVDFTDPAGNKGAVSLTVGYVPTGDIATIAGGPVNTTASPPFGQTTLPAPDSKTVASGPGTAPYPGGNGDSGASTGSQVSPFGVAVGPDGSTYFSEIHTSGPGGDIRAISPAGLIVTVAGGGTTTPTTGGIDPTEAKFDQPEFVAVDNAGDLFVGDSGAATVYMIPKASGTYYGVAMTGGELWPVVGGSAETKVGALTGLAVAPDGTLYWSDSSSRTVEQLAPAASSPTTVVDGTTPAAGGSDPLGSPQLLAVDPEDGTLYLANRCSSCSVGGSVVESLKAVSGIPTLTDISPGHQWLIGGLAVDSQHNVYISDDSGVNGTGKTIESQVLRVAAGTSTLQAVAGQLPTSGANGLVFAPYQNGVPATSTGLELPFGLSSDPTTGNLAIVQAAAGGIGGTGAKAVRILSNSANAPGQPYTPGPPLGTPPA